MASRKTGNETHIRCGSPNHDIYEFGSYAVTMFHSSTFATETHILTISGNGPLAPVHYACKHVLSALRTRVKSDFAALAPYRQMPRLYTTDDSLVG